MNATQSFQLAAICCGMTAFMIAALWRVIGTNQGNDVKQNAIGATVVLILMSFAFWFVSLIIKNSP